MPVAVSRANKALIVPPVPGVLSLFPTAPRLPDGNVILSHGIRETLFMRHLGFKCPGPVMHYNYAGGSPFAVQKRTVEMLVENPRAYVLNAMGTGKTRAALWAWDFLRKEGAVNKLLVVAPLSTLIFVWAREAFGILPGVKVQILHGSKQDRLDRLAQDADIYVINHDGLKVIQDSLSTRPDIDALVIDELAVYRNNSDRSKRMRKFAQRFSVIWGLSGAPIPQSPVDVWGEAMIVTPNRVSHSKSHVRDELMTRINTYVWKPKPDAVERAYKILQPAVRYTLDDVTELPELVERPLEVALSAQQKKFYEEVRINLVAMIHGKQINALNAGAALNKLLQIAGGWVYSAAPEFVRLDASPRMAALIDLIQSAEQKVIVYVPYRHMIEGIAGVFDRLKVGFDYAVVHGDTTKREPIFNAFQHTDKYHCLLAHPGTIKHGLTLTAADTVVWYLPVPSLEVFEQCNARITRVGQKHRQQVIMFQSTPAERRLYTLLRAKQRLQDKLLDLVEEATANT